MNKWKEIWNKEDRVNDHVLETLIKADGFDSGAGSFSLADWKKYTNEHFLKLNIDNNDTIYDVGCGSGAFVYPLYLQNHKVGGIDYSLVLTKLANSVMRNSDFECGEAAMIDPDRQYDLVVSHSVFQYFEDLDYAKKVIKKMLRKANKKIAVFDINDKSKENEYDKIRRREMDASVYNKKYSNLKHLFYEKSWFKHIAKEYGWREYIYDQSFSGYLNSAFRFNVIMEK